MPVSRSEPSRDDNGVRGRPSDEEAQSQCHGWNNHSPNARCSARADENFRNTVSGLGFHDSLFPFGSSFNTITHPIFGRDCCRVLLTFSLPEVRWLATPYSRYFGATSRERGQSGDMFRGLRRCGRAGALVRGAAGGCVARIGTRQSRHQIIIGEPAQIAGTGELASRRPVAGSVREHERFAPPPPRFHAPRVCIWDTPAMIRRGRDE